MGKISLQPVGETALIGTGAPLLSALPAKDLNVLMSCGGKGLCATCHVHVREGMGDLSPAGEQVDKYLLVECVGRGGAGVVYRALHTKLKTPVAIKFLRADVLSGDAQALERFTREAQLLAQLTPRMWSGCWTTRTPRPGCMW